MKIKKLLTIIFIVMIGISPILSSSYASPITNQEGNGSQKKWTVLFYDDADSVGMFDVIDWFAEEAFSTEYIDVIILQDTNNGPAYYWYVDENHDKILLEELGEVNMGNYTTLNDFINYGKNNYPADRYMFFFYDHGYGWKGACIDDTNGSDILSMDEIQNALTDAGGVDIVCFSAPCLMGAVESAYELRYCTEIYVGSEEGSSYIHWRYMIGDLCTLLNEDLDISNVELGRTIIKLIKNEHSPFVINFMPQKAKGRRAVTMSAIDTSKIVNVAVSIDKLAHNLSEIIETSYFKIKLIRVFTQTFAKHSNDPRVSPRSIYDVYDLAKKCYIFFFFNCSIRTNSKNVMECINEAVIANLNGLNHPRAHGLTIYFPKNLSLYDASYAGSELDFTNNTYWDEFLENYLNR